MKSFFSISALTVGLAAAVLGGIGLALALLLNWLSLGQTSDLIWLPAVVLVIGVTLILVGKNVTEPMEIFKKQKFTKDGILIREDEEQ